jgi:hypothetical protein
MIGLVRRALPALGVVLVAGVALAACGSGSSDSTTPDVATSAFAGGGTVAPARATTCADLLKLPPDDRRSTLGDLRFSSGLETYTDKALLASCRKHATAGLLAEAKMLDGVARKAQRARAAAKAKARKAKQAANAAKAALNRARYTKQDRNSFVGACITTGGTVTKCACAFRQFTEHVPYDQFEHDNQAILDGRMSTADIVQRYGSIISRCASF